MANKACQPIGTDRNEANIFNSDNRKQCEKYVCSIQRKLDKAVANDDKEKIRWYVHLLSKRSRAVKILAVYHVTAENKGRYTAGIDGIRMIKGRKGKNEQLRLSLLLSINIKKKPSPIKRVFIPKSNGKKRPLGILTMLDRIIQEILRMTLEAITEYHASDNSYGFRPKRSCHDAIEHLYNKLSQRWAKEWVIEGDISGCFDNISHHHILNTLREWYVPNNITIIIKKMLTAKIFSDDELHSVDTGTPQGGILSPMLANVALTALDNYCLNQWGEKFSNSNGIHMVNPIVRYADDFVVVCKSQQEAVNIKEKIANFLESDIGLTLSEEKTEITHIQQGFDFLGFNVRKYPHKSPRSKYHDTGILRIIPQKEKVINFLSNIQEVLNKNKTSKPEYIIRLLNPMLQGFAMYYRFVISKDTFSSITHNVWEKLFRWAKRRHPKKPKWWIRRKYFTMKGKRKWIFSSPTGDKILCIDTIPIVRYVKIKPKMRLHAGDKDTNEYWNKRVYTNALSQVYSIKVKRLMTRQKGICPCCGNPITKDDIAGQRVHAHHMLPRSEGGTDGLNNLRLLHLSCHNEAHSVLTRKEMAYWMKKKLNYTLKEN